MLMATYSHINPISPLAMSEKLCLQWDSINHFKENVSSALARLRDDKDFTDVTLACEDGQQMEAHKVILAASSPFFEKIFMMNKHPHPLIFFRGFHSQDLMATLDFLYFGEANVFQENLDSFLSIAEELKLEGLAGQNSSDLLEEKEKPKNLKPVKQIRETATSSDSVSIYQIPNLDKVFTKEFSGDFLQALDEKVKSLRGKSRNKISDGKQADGTPKQTTASICKVCGKEGLWNHIRSHIETNHLEGISISCDYCDKTFSTRQSLGIHKSRSHK